MRTTTAIALGVAAGAAVAVVAGITVLAPGPRHRTTPSAERSDGVPSSDAPLAALPAPPRVAGPAPGPVPMPSDTAPDEAGLMDRLRKIEDGDPTLALQLAREGDARFPSGADAAERAMIVVKSLARQGDVSEARGKAEEMVNVYAGTRWALEVEQHTGAHPHRSR